MEELEKYAVDRIEGKFAILENKVCQQKNFKRRKRRENKMDKKVRKATEVLK